MNYQLPPQNPQIAFTGFSLQDQTPSVYSSTSVTEVGLDFNKTFPAKAPSRKDVMVLIRPSVGLLDMAKVWKEEFDGTRHSNKMDGAARRQRPQANFVPEWVFFVRTCSFTFEFHNLDEIAECLAYYSQKLHPSSRLDIGAAESWEAQRWSERLPMYLLEEPKRLKVVKALASALEQFEAEGFKR